MPGWRSPQRRPFGLRLLHPIFAEDALAGGDQRRDRLAPWVLEMAISSRSIGSRPASAAAWAIAARTVGEALGGDASVIARRYRQAAMSAAILCRAAG